MILPTLQGPRFWGALAAVLAALCAWPLRDALWTGRAPGAGPDVVSTLWGMWWMQQTGPQALIGAHTQLANAPEGAVGSVLSPLGAITFALTEPLLGVGRAASLVAVEQTAGFALVVGVLAAVLGLGRAAVVAAALATLAGRVLFFALGEGSVVAIAALPVPLGLAALLAPAPGRVLQARLLFAVFMVGVAAENPYLAPVLPAVAALRLGMLWRAGRQEELRPLALGLVLGSLGVLAVAAVFGRSADPSYPGEIANRTVMLGPLPLQIVDMPWARATPQELLLPGAVRWTLDVEGGALAGGGRYLGLSVLALGALALARTRRVAGPWALLALVMVGLGMGSILPGGLAGPFLFLNAVMDAVARPLTQPTRFLLVAQVGLAVLVALGVQGLGPRGRAGALTLLAGDALLLGGLSLRLPSLELPERDCPAAWFAEHPGPVLLWPHDARDGDASASQLAQLAHGQPAPHRGIASWLLPGTPVLRTLRATGWRVHGPQAPMEVQWARLAELGFRWVVVEQTPGDPRVAELHTQLGAPVAVCDSTRIYTLPRGGATPPRR